MPIPPHDPEAEQALLGSMMLDPGVIPDVLRIMPPDRVEWLYETSRRTIWSCLVSMYDRGLTIDLVTVRDELNRLGELSAVGGVVYVADLAESVPSARHAERYAEIVREKGLLRDAMQVGERLTGEALDPLADAREVIETAQLDLDTLGRHNVTTAPATAKDDLVAIQADLEHGTALPSISTGFGLVDEKLAGGLHDGELILIAGRPSMGKTSLGTCMALDMARRGVPVLFLSMEMSRREICQRMICAVAGLNFHSMRQGMLSNRELEDSEAAVQRMQGWPMFIDDGTDVTLPMVRSVGRQMVRRFGIRCFFVDYLQLMRAGGRTDSREREVSEIGQGLKSLGRQLKIPVVVMAQLNRGPESRSDNRPRLSDLRESGSLEQTADVVMLLHRESYYDPQSQRQSETDLIVAKQRNGPTGPVVIYWDAKSTRFTACDPGTIAEAEAAIITKRTYLPGLETTVDAEVPF